ncbi:hypothetical protein Pmani_007923 [Petrolisthes manimaculis]|uniref:Uncharacterized protein n=1 Tax=Petrolisthes manimaculis TaxID=1843537 RepID=A0AAE1Q7D6_9EUCA|nr:hypothetical protein Pmani_007923 [Petrolisthes manimaculis]
MLQDPVDLAKTCLQQQRCTWYCEVQKHDTPQSATTDIRSDADQLVHEGARCIKLLSKQLAKYYNQICLQAEDITIQVVEGS